MQGELEESVRNVLLVDLIKMSGATGLEEYGS